MPKISEEARRRIIVAIEALVAEGVETPTNEQVLERLGSGSLSYVSPVMREWRAKRKEAAKVLAVVPESLKEVGQNVVVQVWTSALKIAMASAEEIKREADERTTSLEIELDDVLNKLDAREQRIQELEKQLAAANSEVSRYRDDTVHLRSILEAKQATDEELINRNKQLTEENRALLIEVGAAKARAEALERIETLIKGINRDQSHFGKRGEEG